MKNLYPLAASCCLKTITIILLCFPLASKSQESMRANLYVVDANGATLVDGNLTNYNDIYSDAVDIDDAWKMTNPGINFGVLRDSYNLVVERRSFIDIADTTYFRMWNMPQLNYRIRFVLRNLNHPGLKAVVKDNYLNTETTVGLNDTTFYDFTINSNPASGNETRFQLIFGVNSFTPIDVNFTGIQAQRKNKDILVEWGVANEVSMQSYIVEHSADGRNFHELQQLAPYNTPVAKTYSYKDIRSLSGDNFYRIKGLSYSGRVQYSPIAKVSPLTNEQEITVYPNPVANKTAQLQFINCTAGKYSVVLLHNNGIQQLLPSIQLNQGQTTASISLPLNLAAGLYRLQLIGTNNKPVVKTIEVL